MKKQAIKIATGALSSLLTLAMLAPMASAVDWTGTKSVGAFVGFDQYAAAAAPYHTNQIQGVSFLYGLNDKWRLGGELGLSIVSGGSSPSVSDTQILFAPLAEYDLISKPSGSLYAVGRLLNYSSQNAAVSGGGATTKAWALNYAAVGAGIEALISNDFSVYFEGDLLRLGQTGGTGGSAVSDVGFFVFPGVRMGMKMYFGGPSVAAAPATRSSATPRF